MYATASDYAAYVSDTVPVDIDRLIEQAEDQVDSVTFNRIRGVGFEKLTPYQQIMIKKAVCHQVSFLQTYGQYEGVTSFSAGGVSVSMDTTSLFNGQPMGRKAIEYLRNTGLASRNVQWGRGHYV